MRSSGTPARTRVEDQPHDRTHLVVGVGGRHDPGGRTEIDGCVGRVGRGEPEARQRGPHRGVGAGPTGEPGDDGGGHVPAEHGEEPCRGARQLLGEVHDDGAEIGEQRDAVVDGDDRGIHEVALVVPPGCELAACPARDADDVGRPPPGAHQRIERLVVDRRELAVGVDERSLGGRVLGDGGEHAGRVGEDRADRGREDRRGHGAAVRTRQARRADELGQPVGGEEGDAGDAVAALGDPPEGAAREQPPCGHADVVGGDHHGDRGERIALLPRDDRVEQRPGCRVAVGHGHEVDGHRPGSYGRRVSAGCDRRAHAAITPRGCDAHGLRGGEVPRPGGGDDQLDTGVEVDRGRVEDEVVVARVAGVAPVEVLHVRLTGPVGLAEQLAGLVLVELLEADGPLDARLERGRRDARAGRTAGRAARWPRRARG